MIYVDYEEIARINEWWGQFGWIVSIALIILPFAIPMLYYHFRDTPLEKAAKAEQLRNGTFGVENAKRWNAIYHQFTLPVPKEILEYKLTFSLYYVYRAMLGLVDRDNWVFARQTDIPYKSLTRVEKDLYSMQTTDAKALDIYSYMVFFYNHYPEARPLVYGYADILCTSFGALMSAYGGGSYYGGALPCQWVNFPAPGNYRRFCKHWEEANETINRNYNDINPLDERYKKLELPFVEKQIAPIMAKCYLLYLEDLRGRIARENYTAEQAGNVYKHSYRLLDFVLRETDIYILKLYIKWFNERYPEATEEERMKFIRILLYSDQEYVDEVLEMLDTHQSKMRYAKMDGNRVVEVNEHGDPVSEELKEYYKNFSEWYDMPPYEPILLNLPQSLFYVIGYPDIQIKQRDEKRQNNLKYRLNEREALHKADVVNFNERGKTRILPMNLAPKDITFEH